MQVSDALRQNLNDPTWRAGYIEGVIDSGTYAEFTFALLDRLVTTENSKHEWKELAEARADRMEQLNYDVAHHADVKVECKVCGQMKPILHDIGDFYFDGNYCGGSPRCCP